MSENEVVSTPTPEVTVSSTPEPVSTPAPVETKAEVTEGGDGALPTKPVDEYKPDFKFKFGKGVGESGDWEQGEGEIEEWLRGAIKDKDTEEKARSIYAKAFGLDAVKPKYEAERKRATEKEDELTTLRGEIGNILEHKKRGDIGAYLEAVGVNDDEIASYMLEKLKRRDLPPDQQKVYNEFEKLKRDSVSKDKQVQEMNRMWQQAASQARRVELDAVLSRADVNQLMSKFDSGAEGQGAFREEVINHALAVFNTTGKDLTAEEAVKAVSAKYARFFPQGQGDSTASVAETKSLPVIPNVGGRNVSPTEKIPTSIADLKKTYAELVG